MPIVQEREVSNSEAITMGECARKWMYQYHRGYHLESVTGNLSFDRGTAVHDIMEYFFRALMDGCDYDTAVKIAMTRHTQLILDTMGTDLCIEVQKLKPAFDAYFINERERILTWEILGVELLLRMPIAFGLTLVGRIDLLIKVKSGPFKGETIPVD